MIFKIPAIFLKSMPYVKKYPRRYRKRTTVRRKPTMSANKRYRKTFKKVPRGLSLGRPGQAGPFPAQLFTKLKYYDLEEISITTSAINGFTYNLNSLFDPYFTGGGIQPRFFDTLCGPDAGPAPYNKYRVMGAKVRVSFLNDNTSGGTIGMVGMHWRDAANSAPGSIYDLQEMPNSKTRLFGTLGANQGIVTLKKYISMKQILAVKDMRDDEDSAAQYNADPAALVRLDCLYQPYGSLVTTTVFMQVNITFYCQFFEQNIPAQS